MLGNLVANQAGFVLPVVITFFLSPFVVHTLGDDLYGLWSLIVSFTGHYSILTLGVQSAATRYVAWAAGKGDEGAMSRTVSSSLAMLLPAAALTLLVGAALALVLGRWFDVPPGELHAAQVACLLVALTAAVNFGTAVFACILTAHQRFDTLNLVRTGAFALRSALTVVLLMQGFRIRGLAALGLATMAVSGLVFWALARRQAAGWRISASLVDGETVRTLFGYGLKSFVGTSGMMLKYQLDLVLVGLFLAPADIAMYSLGSTLLMYVVQFVHALVHVFEPWATQRFAREGVEGLRGLFLSGSAFFYVLGGLLVGGALVFARPFYSLWIDPEHIQAGTIFTILVGPMFFTMGARFGHAFLVAMARIGTFNAVGLAAGVVKIGLAAVLIPRLGVEGAAWASVVPFVVAEGIWFVPFIARVLGIPVWRIVVGSMGRGVVVGATAWGAGTGIVVLLPPSSWGGLAAGVGVTAAVGGIAALLILPRHLGDLDWRAALLRQLRRLRRGEVMA
jgi:O-antigen/teichoic acid export membrane protein